MKINKIIILLVPIFFLVIGFCYGQSALDSSFVTKANGMLLLVAPLPDYRDSVSTLKNRSQNQDSTSKKATIKKNTQQIYRRNYEINN